MRVSNVSISRLGRLGPRACPRAGPRAARAASQPGAPPGGAASRTPQHAARCRVAAHDRWLKRRDPTRPVQYENARVEPGWDTHELETIDGDTDIYCPMYPSPAKLERYAALHELDPCARCVAAAHRRLLLALPHARPHRAGR